MFKKLKGNEYEIDSRQNALTSQVDKEKIIVHVRVQRLMQPFAFMQVCAHASQLIRGWKCHKTLRFPYSSIMWNREKGKKENNRKMVQLIPRY